MNTNLQPNFTVTGKIRFTVNVTSEHPSRKPNDSIWYNSAKLTKAEREVIITPYEVRTIAIAKGTTKLTILPLLTGTVPDTVQWSKNLLLNKFKFKREMRWLVTYTEAANPAHELFPVLNLDRAIRFIQQQGYKDNASYSFQTAGRK